MRTFFVRHGEYEPDPPMDLSVEGGKQSIRAAFALSKAHNLGHGALVLAAKVQSAQKTAEIIANVLRTRAMPSLHASVGENHGLFLGIQNMDTYWASAVAAQGVETPNEDAALVVVTHKPLIALIKGDDDVAHGEVVPYEPNKWEGVIAAQPPEVVAAAQNTLNLFLNRPSAT